MVYVRVCWLGCLLFEGLVVWLIVLLCMFLLYITWWGVCFVLLDFCYVVIVIELLAV